jgi:hypothetical protein
LHKFSNLPLLLFQAELAFCCEENQCKECNSLSGVVTSKIVTFPVVLSIPMYWAEPLLCFTYAVHIVYGEAGEGGSLKEHQKIGPAASSSSPLSIHAADCSFSSAFWSSFSAPTHSWFS